MFDFFNTILDIWNIYSYDFWFRNIILAFNNLGFDCMHLFTNVPNDRGQY